MSKGMWAAVGAVVVVAGGFGAVGVTTARSADRRDDDRRDAVECLAARLDHPDLVDVYCDD